MSSSRRISNQRQPKVEAFPTSARIRDLIKFEDELFNDLLPTIEPAKNSTSLLPRVVSSDKPPKSSILYDHDVESSLIRYSPRSYLSPHERGALVKQEPKQTYHAPLFRENSSSSKETTMCYVAKSMRGNCFHAYKYCDGLRSANGTSYIPLSSAKLRGMSACKVCRPSSGSGSEDSDNYQELCSRKEIKTGNQQRVFVAASMKGRCYHSEEHCYGLRTASGVTSISLRNANDMAMVPCKVCKPTIDRHRAGGDGVSEKVLIKDHYDYEESSSRNEFKSEAKQRVFVATSMKGRCFHSKEHCYGLRTASGVTEISLQKANDMTMVPCKVCKPTTEGILLPSPPVPLFKVERQLSSTDSNYLGGESSRSIIKPS